MLRFFQVQELSSFPDGVVFRRNSAELLKRTDNPMQPEILAKAARCGARTRTGSPCLSPAVRGRRRCRMHGGTNKGPPSGNRNALVHGNRSAEAEAQLRTIRATDRDLRLLTKIRLGAPLQSSEHHRVLQWLLERGELEIGKQSGLD